MSDAEPNGDAAAQPAGLSAHHELTDRVRTLLQGGGILSSLSGVTPQARESLYVLAYDTYRRGAYEKAHRLFSRLVTLDHMEPKYANGLAAASQMLGRYQQALQLYAAVTVMKLDDPEPVMRSGDCLKALGRPVDANESYALALSLCVRPEHDAVRQRCVLLLHGAPQCGGSPSGASC